MIKITKQELLHLAELSKLSLDEGEITELSDQLSEIISHISVLSGLSTSDIEPTSQTTDLTNIYMGDTIKVDELLPVSGALSGTENVHNNLFKVPMLLTNKEDE